MNGKQQWSTQMNLHSLQSNELLLLNDPHCHWVIRSGAVALFTIAVKSGTAEGERRYLFNAAANEAMFGMTSCDRAGLVAVALEPVELCRLVLPHSELPSLIEKWISNLSQIHGFPVARGNDFLSQAQHISLMKGQIYQPQSQMTWVKIQQGNAFWLGNLDLPFNSDSGFFPVGNGMWLEAGDDLELVTKNTSEIEDSHLLTGLAQLHTYFLQCVDSIATVELQAASLRFQQRQHLNQQVTQDTLQNLVSVLHPQHENLAQLQTPLLMVAGAVGRAMGVTIAPPLKSENLTRVKEPLEAIARSSQLRLRRVLLRDRWWQKDSGAILAYTRMDKHPVALLPCARSRYELFDPIQSGLANDAHSANMTSDRPSAPTRILVNEAIAATLDPVAYVFYQPLPNGVLKAIDLLRFALKGRRQDVVSILLTGIGATLLGMLIPQATALLIDTAIPNGDLGVLLQIGLGLLAAAFGSASFQLAQAIASMRIETLSDASLQAAVWDRLLKLKTSFFRQYAIGDLNSRVSGISTIRRKLSGTTLQTLFTGSFSLLNLGLLYYYNAQLATLALGVSLVIVIFTTISSALLVQRQRALMELEGSLFGILVQLINGVPKLRIAGVEERAFAHWGQKYTRQLQILLSTQLLDIVALFNTVTPTLAAIALFWLASRLIRVDQVALSVGTFLAFNVAFGTFISGVSSLSITLTEVLDVVPLWQRSQPILTADPELGINKADPGRISGSVLIDRVTFRYRDDGALILNNVTIQAQPGEFIALVGPSGSGKSTILRLLLGFETPNSGTVYYDGQDLAGLDVAAVRRQLGVVLQNGRINAGSMFENISSGALITLEEAWTAAENSGLADDIRAMPMQMHTIVSEGGTNLSGGQRQRLVIARALALQPRILLLDEATSALDNKTQAIVSQSLDRLQVTRIAIAHRLSTIRNADRIYVLEAGQVVQQGKFEDLAQQPGLFAQLIRRQIA
jgi:NHLM bacteriocin system ABC transporter ATP-binding protein